MITKRIAGRKDGRSSAAGALRYGEGLTPDRETGETLDKSHRTRLGNFGLVDDGVYIGQDMAALIELAAIEMQSTIDMNTRVGMDKRLAHFVVSYNQYRPSEAVLRDTEDSTLSALKLDKNHFATFLHDDNGYWHLHMFCSRIEKENPYRGNELWHDQIIRDKVCREVEIRHGLERDKGAHRIDEAGQIVEIPFEERRKLREQKTVIGDRARTAEIYSGEKSFQTWVNEIRIGDRLKHAKSWQDLHAAASAYGCEIRAKGAGFIICPIGEKGGIQLSKVGLKNLHAKFGAFVSPGETGKVSTQPYMQYKPEPTNAKAASQYDKWSAAKTAFKPFKIEKINEQREMHKRARKLVRTRNKSELEKVRTDSKGAERFSAISIAKMEQAAALATLSDRHAQERRALHLQLEAEGPGNTFRDYLVREAGRGDNQALGLARKYGVEESTEVLRRREADQLQIVAAVAGMEYRAALRLRFTHKIERNGTVIFNLGRGRIVTDSAISKQIQLNSAAAADPNAIATSLRFAQAKFGSTLTLTGSQEFQRLAVETAVRNRLGIRFADTALEAYKQQFTNSIQHNSKQEKCHVTRTPPYHPRQVPPAHRRDRLHNLSELTMVPNLQTPEMLLPKNVPGGLAKRDAGQRDGDRLRRLERAGGRDAFTDFSGPGPTVISDRTAGNVADAGTPRTSTGRIWPGSGRAGERASSSGEHDGISVISPSNNQQAQRAAASAAEEATERADHTYAAPSQVLMNMPPRPSCQEWISANPGKPAVAPCEGSGRVVYIDDDGQWIHDLGRTIVLRSAGFATRLGDKVRVDKNGLAHLPGEIENGKGRGR